MLYPIGYKMEMPAGIDVAKELAPQVWREIGRRQSRDYDLARTVELVAWERTA